MRLDDRRLIEWMAANPKPDAGSPYKPQDIWAAMNRAGASAYEGFPSVDDPVDDMSIQRVSAIAKELLDA